MMALQALEQALRHFLYEMDMSASAEAEVAALEPGAVRALMASSALTNPDSLGVLIDKFNRTLPAARQSALAIDPGLASAREALGHGRIWGSTAEPPLRIVEFGRPANGMVECTFDEVLDSAWLEARTRGADEALQKVTTAARDISPERWAPGKT
jgi:hypothetical protein